MYPYYDTAAQTVMKYSIVIEIPKNLQAEERAIHEIL